VRALPQRVPAPWEPAPFGNRTAREDIACPYHRWTWTCGATSSTSRPRRFPDFDDAASHSTRPLQIWEGFVFVNLDSKAESLLDYLSPLTERLPLPLREHTRTRSVTMPLAANWKTIVDGFPRRVPPPGCPPPTPQGFDDVNTTYELPVGTAPCTCPWVSPSRLARPQRAGGHRRTGARRLGFHGSCSASRSTSWRRAARPRSVTASRSPGPARSRRIEGEAQGRDYSGLSDEQMGTTTTTFLFPNTVSTSTPATSSPLGSDPKATDAEGATRHVHLQL